jgi:hypothetical protein
MENEFPFAASAPIAATKAVEELFDTLSALPPLTCCCNCGSKLLHVPTTFFSDSGKVWTLLLPVCTDCKLPPVGAPM